LKGSNITDLTPFIDEYVPNLDTYAVWGPFSLEQAEEAQCVFWYWNDSELNNDFLAWGASTDVSGQPFYEGDRVSGPNYTNLWNNAVLDLNDLEDPYGNPYSMIGEEEVYIVFYFHSNGYNPVEYWGGFIDDISLGWNDGLFDLEAVLPEFLDADSNSVTIPMEGQDYIVRFQWDVEGNGSTGPFTVECEMDDEFFYSQEYNLNVIEDTTIYTYADMTWAGDIGPHTMEWTVDVDNQVYETYENNNYSLYEFEVVLYDSLPWIIITRPTEGDSADEGFWIQWEAYDRESNATIYLYYDNDATGFNGGLINYTPIYEDTDPDSFWWNTASLSEGNEYYIYGLISDGFNMTQSDYSDFPLIIHHPLNTGEGNFAQPEVFYLTQNYPNPFNSSTTLSYSLPEKSMVDITIFDIRGRLVDRLVHEEIVSGTYELNWSPQVGSGVYFCKAKIWGIESGKIFDETKKMLYVR